MPQDTAKLTDLITDMERIFVFSTNILLEIPAGILFRDMTVKQLTAISFPLIETEYGKTAPKGILSALAIEILTKRAIEKGLPTT
tara:strand:- start:59 stop:313 length:255 start_codon:yes stop_codon:yes gene_type:complete